MKKFLGVITAVTVMATFLVAGTAALAESDTFAQPDGGKKFESHWAAEGADISIDYEEEGYRVSMSFYNPDNLRGTEYAYNCFYEKDKDALVSVSSSKTDFTVDAETFDRTFAPETYDDVDEAGQETVFTINDKGSLVWKDGHEQAAESKEFQNIGSFQGQYENKAAGLIAEINWEGTNANSLYYTVYVQVNENKDLHMTGVYNPQTKKLECTGFASQWVDNAEGGSDPSEEMEDCTATFSMTEDGKLVYESADGVVLDFVDFTLD